MRPRSRILLVLALGALTTVAIAWTCALLPSTTPIVRGTSLNINEHGARPRRELNIGEEGRTGRRMITLRILHRDGPDSLDWRMFPELQPDIEDAMDSFPEERGESSEAARALYDSTGGWPGYPGWPHWPRWFPDIPHTEKGLALYSVRAAGWPLPALRSTAQSPDPSMPATWRWSWRWLSADHYTSTGDPQIGAVPLAPIPLYFAADALIYALGWWLLLLGPRDVRRWWRRRRALCEFCGYSTAGLPKPGLCPECGRPIR